MVDNKDILARLEKVEAQNKLLLEQNRKILVMLQRLSGGCSDQTQESPTAVPLRLLREGKREESLAEAKRIFQEESARRQREKKMKKNK